MTTDLNCTLIILTFNESSNLPKLLDAIKNVPFQKIALDSGSTDNTKELLSAAGFEIFYRTFDNHPKQWDYALTQLPIKNDWVFGIDADQVPSEVALNKLIQNINILPSNVEGVYVNRHFYFQGKRLRFGGYKNKYMLKLFRLGKGRSDLSENMDHRFVVSGETVVWKDAVLREENFKENDWHFWKSKQKNYAKLIADEEIDRRVNKVKYVNKGSLFGTPDQKIWWLKSIWWRLPLFVRPFLYVFIRMILQFGVLEHNTGRKFHWHQAFCLRWEVDRLIFTGKNKI